MPADVRRDELGVLVLVGADHREEAIVERGAVGVGGVQGVAVADVEDLPRVVGADQLDQVDALQRRRGVLAAETW